MKIILALAAIGLLAGCSGSDEPEQSTRDRQDQAVENVREALNIGANVSDRKVRSLLWDACDLLDDHSAQEVSDQLDMAPVLVDPVLENAASGFCPNHMATVLEYTG